jgi:hypothetical protein
MYAKVPEDLKPPLIKELKRSRRNCSLKYFPVLVVVFSFFFGMAAYSRGHAFFEIFRRRSDFNISDTTLVVFVIGLVVIATTAFLIFVLRLEYRNCKYQDFRYCGKCNIVDAFDYGLCPICNAPFSQEASFFFTHYKNEEKIIERWKFQTFHPALYQSSNEP